MSSNFFWAALFLVLAMEKGAIGFSGMAPGHKFHVVNRISRGSLSKCEVRGSTAGRIRWSALPLSMVKRGNENRTNAFPDPAEGSPWTPLLQNATDYISEVDDVLTINDISVISLYSFSMAIIAQISMGPKAVPGYGMEDLLFLARTFSDAAIFSGSWVIAGLATGIIKREHTFGFQYFFTIIQTWVISTPLAQLIKSVAGNPSPIMEMGRDSVWILALLLMWRAFDANLPSL